MSKIGKQLIKIPEGVTVAVDEEKILIKGPKGELGVRRIPHVLPEFNEAKKELKFTAEANHKQARSNWGTIRAHAANAVEGVTKGFEKTLILEGVGYRIVKVGEGLEMTLGFSHPVKYEAKPGISFEVEKNTTLRIRGIDRELVGQVAAEIRAIEKAEPYKGRGFRYSDEVIRRKAGKKAVAASGGA
ncbi:MAG: 50S ribosomal protein L6 [Candidatus Jorgensenbacteria bacterium]